jgi:hypothetical protein
MLAYLWTCSHRKIEGLFELPLGYIASDLNIPIVVVEEKIKLLEEKGFVAYEDEVIFIKGYMSVQNKLQGKVPADTIKGIINNLKQLQPSKKLLTLWANDARNIPQLWQGLQENGLKLEEVSPGLESEYILSTYSVSTEYVPSGSGSGIGSGNITTSTFIFSSAFMSSLEPFFFISSIFSFNASSRAFLYLMAASLETATT